MGKVFLYWDDFLADEITGTNLVKKKKMNYTHDGTPYYTARRIKKETKLTRTQKVYEDFKALSHIEKENFVNMIRNFVVHGHL